MSPLERLWAIAQKERKLIIGLMSGTSADGVSAVVAEIKGCGLDTKFKLIRHNTYPYPRGVKEKLFAAFRGEASTPEICLLNFVIGELFAKAALAVIEEAGLSIHDVDLVASHGQTIWHQPALRELEGIRTRATLQIGEPAVIAERTGRPVVADFRVRDVAAGGQGAPISAYVDYILFRREEESVAVQNIGGIANVTYLPAGCGPDDVVAFDTGPGNMVIDALVRLVTKGEKEFDEEGAIAARGRVSKELLRRLMRHPFIRRRPPKTTGREEFGEHFALEVYRRGKALGLRDEDIIATVTAFTVEAIAYSYEHFLPGKVNEVILGGGGCFNKTLVAMLRERLQGVKVSSHEDYGIPAQAKEPLVIAILANEAICGNPNNLPSATGARSRVVMGKVVL